MPTWKSEREKRSRLWGRKGTASQQSCARFAPRNAGILPNFFRALIGRRRFLAIARIFANGAKRIQGGRQLRPRFALEDEDGALRRFCCARQTPQSQRHTG